MDYMVNKSGSIIYVRNMILKNSQSQCLLIRGQWCGQVGGSRRGDLEVLWRGNPRDILRENTSDNKTPRDMEVTVVILGQLLLVASVIGGGLEE